MTDVISIIYARLNNGTAVSCAAGYGFPLSIESGGSGNWASHPVNNQPFPLCGTVSLSQKEQPVRTDSAINFSLIPNGTSASGVNFLGISGASLSSSVTTQPNVKLSGFHPLGGPTPQGGGSPTSTNAPAWLAIGVSITNPVSFVQFDAGFIDTNSAQGLLTVYWDTNEIGMIDERAASVGLQAYELALPGMATNGLYTLSFRLDSFGNSSSILVTNVATGFVGVTQPITLSIFLTNSVPLIQLAAATNFTYLVQSSTDLVNWLPTALVLNTNGTAQFIDTAATNSSGRFYRAVMP
jgi:hypothetical protein